MKKIIRPVTMLALFILMACNTNQPANTETAAENKAAPGETAIPFTIAVHYFVRNDFREGPLQDYRITTKAAFDSIFGAAATMGKDGLPTPIDFASQDAIALIDSTSNNAVSFENPRLQKDGDHLALSCNKIKGAKQSFATRPFLLLVIDKKYKETVIPAVQE